MATTCPNCGHKFIQRRFRPASRVRLLEETPLAAITNEHGIITTTLLLAHFTKWSKDYIHDVAARMVANGVWARVPGHKGNYIKIRDYIATPRGQAGKSSKRERAALR